MDLGLAEKVVLVTGSSRGLGRVTAGLFGREGAWVVVDYFSHAEAAEETAHMVEQAGGRALVMRADVSDAGSMQALVARVKDAWGKPVQVLVNNAIAFEGEVDFEEMSIASLDRMYAIVVKGAVHAAQACVPGMKAAGWGRIVNITSRGALMGAPRMSHYAAAKSALVGLTRAWAKEFGPWEILTNAVAPTLMLTETMLESLSESAREAMAKRVPVRRLATPEDVARLVLFLGSAANTYVNGEVITVGGGAMS
jgi:3-oxoacyl-[acyl-carrier protein] reductase